MGRHYQPKKLSRRIKLLREDEDLLARVACPHCRHRWRPAYKSQPKWCPKCHKRLSQGEETHILYEKRPLPMLTEINRFTPETMKRLVSLKFYRYKPELDMPPAVGVRGRQKLANVRLADKYMRSEMNQSELSGKLKFNSRAAFYSRIIKGFVILLDHGCFELTQRGREKIARERMKSEVQASSGTPNASRT